jgi:hypothetical protein
LSLVACVFHFAKPSELAVDAGQEHFSAFYRIPRSARDLREPLALIERSPHSQELLSKVGSDALFALLRATEGDEQAKREHSTTGFGDLALAVAQTDVKGDHQGAP